VFHVVERGDGGVQSGVERGRIRRLLASVMHSRQLGKRLANGGPVGLSSRRAACRAAAVSVELINVRRPRRSLCRRSSGVAMRVDGHQGRRPARHIAGNDPG
jgi:hypothetical protein